MRASGFVSGEHRNGETTLPVSSRTQFIINSSTPPKHDALQLVYPCSFQMYVFPGSETPTLIESLFNEMQTITKNLAQCSKVVKYVGVQFVCASIWIRYECAMC